MLSKNILWHCEKERQIFAARKRGMSRCRVLFTCIALSVSTILSACTKALPEAELESEIVSATNAAKLSAINSAENRDAIEGHLRHIEALLADARALSSRSQQSLKSCEELQIKMKKLSARVRRSQSTKKASIPLQGKPEKKPVVTEDGGYPRYSPSDAPRQKQAGS